ncbi:hypothetical protein GQ54DRAFT_308578 [Martensiomyces pterosporus]|nr:hypothetical protein GQ54DRAFT_308578 [Martensiomyces pterosporus]
MNPQEISPEHVLNDLDSSDTDLLHLLTLLNQPNPQNAPVSALCTTPPVNMSTPTESPCTPYSSVGQPDSNTPTMSASPSVISLNDTSFHAIIMPSDLSASSSLAPHISQAAFDDSSDQYCLQPAIEDLHVFRPPSAVPAAAAAVLAALNGAASGDSTSPTPVASTFIYDPTLPPLASPAPLQVTAMSENPTLQPQLCGGLIPATVVSRTPRRSSFPSSLRRTHPYMQSPSSQDMPRRSGSVSMLPSYAQPAPQPSGSHTFVIPAINQDGTYKRCTNCFAAETPSWRRHPDTQALLCNACGLYLRLHRRPRPITVNDAGHIQVIRKNAAVQREPINVHAESREHVGCAFGASTLALLYHPPPSTASSQNTVQATPGQIDAMSTETPVLQQQQQQQQQGGAVEVDNLFSFRFLEGLPGADGGWSVDAPATEPM